MLSIAFVFSAAPGLALGVGNADAVLALIKEQHRVIKDASFQFEGKYEGQLAKKFSPPLYTGRLLYAAPDRLYSESDVRLDGKRYRMEESVSNAMLILTKSEDERQTEPSDRVRQEIHSGRSMHGLSWNHLPSALSIWAPAVFTDVWRVPMLATNMRHLGEELVDGVRTEHLQTWLGPKAETPDEKDPIADLWIDISRGASILKLELRNWGRLACRVHSVALRQFAAADGAKVWLPGTARCDEFEKSSSQPEGQVGSWTFGILVGTEKINSGIPPGTVGVVHDRRWPVVDFDDHAKKTLAYLRKGGVIDTPEMHETGPRGKMPAKEARAAVAEAASKPPDRQPAAKPASFWWWSVGIAAFGAACLAAALFVRSKQS